MLFAKTLIAGIAIAAILGMAGILLIGNAGGVIDDAKDLMPGWGKGGGGCGGYRSGAYDNDDAPACHQRNGGSDGSYCPYYTNNTSDQ
jgi:hypothetical protein